MTPEILFEDNHIIVVNKPAGILSQGDSSGEDSLLDMLKNYIKTKQNKDGDAFLGLVHRLDMPVSGVMVFAKTSKAARRLHSEIVSGNMEKYYVALVESELIDDKKWHRLENFLIRERDITKISIRENRSTQRAELFYKIIKAENIYTLVIIKLITGRKHQIRAQFSEIGAPVAGDKKYGSKTVINNSICLHSVYLSFPHPTLKERLEFYSGTPSAFNRYIKTDKAELKIEILERIDEFRNQALASK